MTDAAATTLIRQILVTQEPDLLADWIRNQISTVGSKPDLIGQEELGMQSRRLLGAVREALREGADDVMDPSWAKVREMLSEIARSRAVQGFSPTETAMFILSMKRPLFERLRRGHASAESMSDAIWSASLLLDRLALFTTEIHQQGREEVILRQQQEMVELSTPVVRLWEGVLALPLIGTLDSNRTQVVMENLLQTIVQTGSSIAILDITGVPTVDTLVAQHLLKTVAAARLMGADCVISGIRPQIAQTIVHLGVDLGPVITKSTLADAFAIALKRAGLAVVREQPAG
jgi:rsbT co-antagonist protein RsbR